MHSGTTAVRQCELCKPNIASEADYACKVCGMKLCSTHACIVDNVPLCPNHAHAHCEICGKEISGESIYFCVDCGKELCEKHCHESQRHDGTRCTECAAKLEDLPQSAVD